MSLPHDDDRLRHRRKLDSLGRLTGGVVHDINNALTAIDGSAKVLARGLGDRPDLRDLADNIVDAVAKASALTRRLLAFARVPSAPTLFAVHDVIESACCLLAPVLDRSIAIELELAATGAAAVGDPSQLENALLNLGFNARDAMPTGGSLRIATRNADDRIEIEVSDSGVGMDRDTAQRAFESFFTTKPPGRGSGLGLPAVRDTVAELGGSIELWTRPGRGARFRISLPVARPATTDDVRSRQLCER